jgi:hypothetical protein
VELQQLGGNAMRWCVKLLDKEVVISLPGKPFGVTLPFGNACGGFVVCSGSFG